VPLHRQGDLAGRSSSKFRIARPMVY
jgi:hypothetical protein